MKNPKICPRVKRKLNILSLQLKTPIQMNKEELLLTALHEIEEFKGDSLNSRLKEISDNYKGKSRENISAYHSLYHAALIIKKASSQIDEMVHALGILNCLPKILLKDEIIESLSLASGAAGNGIDLVTNHRVAEFKFSNWQISCANGIRKRQVFADLVSLYLNDTTKKKELYVLGKESIESYFNGTAKWEKALSKHESLKISITKLRNEGLLIGDSVHHIFLISNVEIIDIESILK